MRSIRVGRGASGALLLFVVLVLAACAAGPGSEWHKPEAPPATFFAGFWHGLIMVITLVVSFFTDQVRIYEPHNVGLAYDIGFVLGTLAAYGSGLRVTFGREPRRKRERIEEPPEVLVDRLENKFRSKFASVLEEEDLATLREDLRRKIRERLRKWLDEDEARPKAD